MAGADVASSEAMRDHVTGALHGGGPDADEVDAQLVLAQLRANMFSQESPVHVGRYRLVRVLGRGAHGSVYEAQDTELLRRVALKVLTSRQPGGVPAPVARRLLREAQAMARVSDPNVVEVYDASVTDGRVWIAMELVEGTTLRGWVQDNPDVADGSRWRSAAALLCQAGLGLAAAHAMDIVHRDFKPTNVLVRPDGVAKVADFGLARAWAPTNRSVLEAFVPEFAERELVQTSGSVLAGTPRYMSPEQLRGERVDAASDQFNFAVTAWEVVFGQHPFEHCDIGTLAAAIASGDVDEPPRGVVPQWYARVLRRALAARPEDRFASMPALVDALRAAPRRRRTIGAVGALTMVVSAGIAWPRPKSAAPVCRAEQAEQRLAGVWGVNARAELQSTLRGVDADGTVDRVVSALDQHGARWVQQQVAACQAGWHGRSGAEHLFDARVMCLRENLETMGALVARLTDADALVAARALAAARSLVDPADCADAEAFGTNHAQERQTSALARARADLMAGRFETASARAQSVANAARQDDALGLAAAALEVVGVARGELNDLRDVEAFSDAYYIAAEIGDDRSSARLAILLARQAGYRQNVPLALTWVRHAQAALQRRPDAGLQLALDHVDTIVVHRQGRDKDAIVGLERLREALEEPSLSREQEELRWLVQSGLASAYTFGKRWDQAEAIALQLRASTVANLGPSHPRLVDVSMTLGHIAIMRKQTEIAIAHMTDAARLAERVYGPVNERTANAWAVAAYAHALAGELDAADEAYRVAMSATPATPSHFTTRLLRGWASVLRQRGQSGQALSLLRRAVSIGEETLPEDSRELASIRKALADAVGALPRAEAGQGRTAHIESADNVRPD